MEEEVMEEIDIKNEKPRYRVEKIQIIDTLTSKYILMSDLKLLPIYFILKIVISINLTI